MDTEKVEALKPYEGTLLKHLECENCGAGYVIETGQILDVYEDEQDRIPYRD